MNKKSVYKVKRILMNASGSTFAVPTHKVYAVLDGHRASVVGKRNATTEKITEVNKIIQAVDKIYNQETEDIERFARIYGKK